MPFQKDLSLCKTDANWGQRLRTFSPCLGSARFRDTQLHTRANPVPLSGVPGAALQGLSASRNKQSMSSAT